MSRPATASAQLGVAVPFHFNQLLREADIDPTEVRLIRHQPKIGKHFVQDAWQTSQKELEAFQALQLTSKRASFSRPFWAVFAGTSDGRTIFLGMYAVGAPEPVATAVAAPLSEEECPAGTLDYYPSSLLAVLKDYSGKLYIEWGGGTSGRRAWVQRAEAQDKAITELSRDAVERPFPGLMAFTQPLSALETAPLGWRPQLAAAKGVYLLTCPTDGSLYVGSATAEGGFWARWSEYMSNGHGGNVVLRDRHRTDYIVSILQAAGSAEEPSAIYAMEERWKQKLGSRVTGLNRN